jgi:hypothetical protein
VLAAAALLAGAALLAAGAALLAAGAALLAAGAALELDSLDVLQPGPARPHRARRPT